MNRIVNDRLMTAGRLLAALVLTCTVAPLRADVRNVWIGVNGATCPT
jgi:hypothetical protein